MARTNTKRCSGSTSPVLVDRPSASKSSFDAGAAVAAPAGGSTRKLLLQAFPPDAGAGDGGEESAAKLRREIERMQDRRARLGGLVARLGPALKLCRRREEEGEEEEGPGRWRRLPSEDGEKGDKQEGEAERQSDFFAAEEVRAVRCSGLPRRRRELRRI